jgi:argonaute-like protein implicated in RNA metabolism and viral defense
MSEKEAIKEIENYLDYEGSVSIQAISILYTLYKKEKEKNKKLEELLQKKNEYTHELEKDLFEGCSNYVVRKDEIKEIIYPTPENPISIETQSSEMYKRLEELLEEE